jgi:hypothetical protein
MYPASLPLISLSPLSIGRKIIGRVTRFAGNLVTMLPFLATSLALSAFIVYVLIPRRTVYLLLFVLALTTAI